MKFLLNIIISILFVFTFLGGVLKYLGFVSFSWLEIFTPLILAFLIKFFYTFLKKKLKIE
jgi:hypothetical protein